MQGGVVTIFTKIVEIKLLYCANSTIFAIIDYM